MSLSEKHKTTRNAMIALCKMFVSRAAHQGYKGKARDRAAIEFLLGAATFAHCIGDKTAYNMLSVSAMIVCTSRSAFEEVEKIANETPDGGTDEVAAVDAAGLATQFDVACVVAVNTRRGAFGIGKTLAEATHNLRREAPMARADVLRLYSCPREALKITAGADLQIQAPLKSFCARLEVEG